MAGKGQFQIDDATDTEGQIKFENSYYLET